MPDIPMRYVIVLHSWKTGITYYSSAYPAADRAYSYGPTRSLWEAGTFHTKEEAQRIVDRYHTPRGRNAHIVLMQSPEYFGSIP